MIIVQLLGGLGNQLFQYAVGRRLAHDYNVPLKLDISAFNNDPLRTYRLSYFNIVEDIAQPSDIWYLNGLGLPPRYIRAFERRTHIYFRKQKIVRENDLGSDILKCGAAAYLEGYWQSEKYFKPVEDLIHKEFTFKNLASPENQKMADKIQGVTSVSLHIRRGDYASNPTTQAVHGLMPLSYYEKAIQELAQVVSNPHFFIFSDDTKWAGNNLKLKYPFTLVDHNTPDTDYEDLHLLSLCQHHIIANSTFSWWGAWLCNNPNKLIYAPAQWFKISTAKNFDIVPTGWKRISP